jgi:hypothetical protein
MKFIKSKKGLVLLATLAVAIAAAVGAYAYWTASGAGSGTAAVGSITSGIQVHQTSTPSGLYPGGPAQALSGDFGNTNSSPAYVTSVTVALSSITNGASNGSLPACTTSDFALSATSNGSAIDNGNGTFTVTVGQDIPGLAGQNANPYAGSWSGVSVGMRDTSANQDNCENATVNLSYTSN